jgi:hypothetical protein
MMVYNKDLSGRIRRCLENVPSVTEIVMFGGVGFLVNGNMACGVHSENLIIRLSPQDGEQALTRPHTRPFDLSGRPMRGWLYVEPDGAASDADLQAWVDRGVAYAQSLPSKK